MDLLLLQIDRIAFHLGTIPVRWYGLLIVSGIILAYIVGQREAVKRGLPEDFLADLLLWAVPISIICARIYYVTMRWDYY
uniref:prolipoprotein diacylglyceryl transferase family protein n=1 Tax=Lysinibacillus fusiformis TaxID=28031 RepID=UPI00201BE9F5